MNELPLIREVFGFRRTECACERCQIYCRHMPGALDPSDLPAMYGDGQDLFLWAEQHLRALIDQPYPSLVPARNNEGHCHWLFDGKCAVHEKAPYSCAFFDAHQSEVEVARRVEAAIRACYNDAVDNGLYYRVWLHLRKKGLIGTRGDLSAVRAESRQLDRRARRHRRRIQES